MEVAVMVATVAMAVTMAVGTRVVAAYPGVSTAVKALVAALANVASAVNLSCLAVIFETPMARAFSGFQQDRSVSLIWRQTTTSV